MITAPCIRVNTKGPPEHKGSVELKENILKLWGKKKYWEFLRFIKMTLSVIILINIFELELWI